MSRGAYYGKAVQSKLRWAWAAAARTEAGATAKAALAGRKVGRLHSLRLSPARAHPDAGQ